MKKKHSPARFVAKDPDYSGTVHMNERPQVNVMCHHFNSPKAFLKMIEALTTDGKGEAILEGTDRAYALAWTLLPDHINYR